MITYKNAASCRYDILSLGEVMLRLDPGDGRIHTTRQFSSNQKAVNIAVVQIWMQLREHADTHPVFSLSVDRTIERVAGNPQIFVHGF